MKEEYPDNKAIIDAFNEANGYKSIYLASEERIKKIIPAEDPRAYANSIVDYENVHSEYSIQNILGVSLFPGQYSSGCSLGNGWVIVDMGEGEEIIDEDGPDLRIYELDSNYNPKWIPESYDVFVSNDTTTWKHLGLGIGTASFDLSKTNMKIARYVKIQGYGPAKSKSRSPGPDIDAIEALHVKAASLPAARDVGAKELRKDEKKKTAAIFFENELPIIEDHYRVITSGKSRVIEEYADLLKAEV